AGREREVFAAARDAAGHGGGGKIVRHRHRPWQPRRGALRPRAEVAPAGRRARRGARIRRPALRQPGASHDQARRVQAELRAVAQGTGLRRAAGAAMNKFFGKYRGTVIQNVDPEQRGRIQVMVPDVSGLIPSSWAMPCVPIAGKQSGVYVAPQIGAGVWIEFEQGDPDYPVWVGGFWGSAAEVP